VWLVDDSVLQPLYDRVKHLLPQELGGGALAGINARWRLYRYTPGRARVLGHKLQVLRIRSRVLACLSRCSPVRILYYCMPGCLAA
jgi:hypothetical protein